MGLGINKEYKGFETSYASIVALAFNKVNNKTEIVVAFYKDEDTMKSEVKDFIKTLNFFAEGEINRSEAYTALKNSQVVSNLGSDYFANATDVGE